VASAEVEGYTGQVNIPIPPCFARSLDNVAAREESRPRSLYFANLRPRTEANAMANDTDYGLAQQRLDERSKIAPTRVARSAWSGAQLDHASRYVFAQGVWPTGGVNIKWLGRRCPIAGKR